MYEVKPPLEAENTNADIIRFREEKSGSKEPAVSSASTIFNTYCVNFRINVGCGHFRGKYIDT